MNVRPVDSKLRRDLGSSRYGSTTSSLWPTIVATFCVATTDPVTRARNIALTLQELLGLPRHDQLLVGRHDPKLHAAAGRVDPALALGHQVGQRIEHDAQLIEPREHRGANLLAVLADAAREHDRLDASQLDEHAAQVLANARGEDIEGELGPL